MSGATAPVTSLSWFHSDASTHEIGALHLAMDALAIGVAIVELSPAGVPVLVAHNEEYRRLIVQPPILGEEVTQLPYACFRADRVTPIPLAEMPGPSALRTGGVVRDVELHVRRADGAWRVLTGSAAASTGDTEGPPRRVIVLVRDITERWATEEALRASEARFAALVDQAADALFIHDDEGHFLDVNQRACQSLGYTREELLRMGVLDVEQDFDLASAQAAWATLQPNAPLTLLGTQRRKDGSVFPVEVRFAAVDLDGRRLFIGLARDISERKLSEQRLAVEKERLRVTLGSIGDAVIATDVEGRVTLLNEVASSLIGWPLDEARGRLLRDVFHIVNEESRVPVVSPVDIVLREGRVVGLANHTSLIARDGSERPIADSGAPIRDASGQIIGVVLVFRDQSEERRVEQELARSRAELRARIERLPIGVFISRSSKILYANPTLAGYLGYSDAAELVGTSLEDMLVPEEHAVGQTYVHREDQPFRSLPGREWRMRRRNGQVVNVETAPTQPVDFEGQRAVLWAARDLTELKAMQAQVMQSDRLAAVGMLAAGVAHEVNNPLTYLIGAIEHIDTIVAGLELPAAQRAELAQSLHEAREGAARVRHVVLDLKTFSRSEEERRTRVELSRVLETALSMASNEIRHRARIVRRFEEAPAVIADEARLGQVFLNLLINAAHAIPEGRADDNEIRVEIGLDAAGRALVDIHDTGSGIPLEVRDRIFDPFVTTKAMGVGTGLGLSICRNTVRALGGEISVESSSSAGTHIRVALPPAPPAVAERAPPASSPTPGGRRGRVLVIDDEPLVGKLIRRCLADEHELTVLSSAHEALALLERGERFDVILCDLMMPQMTGMDLHASLSAQIPDQAARMVLLTGGAFTPGAVSFLARVPNLRLDKPFEPARLRAAVRELIT